jgi:hypothetical protein
MQHVPAVKRFVGEHEKEVVEETDGRGRRGSVYKRMDSDSGHNGVGAGADTDATAVEVDDVSLEEEDLEKMGGDEVSLGGLVVCEEADTLSGSITRWSCCRGSLQG